MTRKTSLFLPLLMAALALAGCHSTVQHRIVPCIPADQLERSGFAARTGTADPNAERKSVILVCPSRGRVEIAVKGGEKLFQVLSSGGALEDYMNRHWTKMAIIRPFRAGAVAGSDADESGDPGVFVVMVDATGLLENGKWVENNVTIAAGDTIVIPDEAESVEQKLLEDYGFILGDVNYPELRTGGEADARKITPN